ncbi:MAG TPA: PorV/PorQ family protein [Caldithrix abyssi]|uniref:PorV/PorQ family protein n=1 Tax=Caldithrix abyssi TaxID=187145 RepID=A0A7V4TZJ3_CALAY|nr:PorV/PorQ family protein [Caldithrix abyssi]
MRKPFIYLGFILLLLFIFLIPRLYAQGGEEDYAVNFAENISNRGTSAAAFLEIGIGAKALGLGGAFTAYANDASALYWNPAGITELNRISVSANHTGWLANTKLEYFGLVLPVGESITVGLILSVLDYVDQQPVRTILQPEGTGEYYDASDLLLGVSFAVKLTNRFSFGCNAKYIQQKIWHESAKGFAIDVGILYHTIWDGLTIGASISNFGTDMQLSGRDLTRPYDDDPQNYSNDKLNTQLKTDAFPLPLLFRFGLAYTMDINSNNQITALIDLNHPSSNVEYVNTGLEYMLMKRFAIRAGFQSLFDSSRENGLTFGAGLNYDISSAFGITFNYAYSDWGILGNVQRFSIDLDF